MLSETRNETDFLAAIDSLVQYPELAENFLRNIRPSDIGQIPVHPVERCLDLFFLNTAEHFPLVLSSEASEELLLTDAFPYLVTGTNCLLLEVFEAAHSLMLVVFAFLTTWNWQPSIPLSIWRTSFQ